MTLARGCRNVTPPEPPSEPTCRECRGDGETISADEAGIYYQPCWWCGCTGIDPEWEGES